MTNLDQLRQVVGAQLADLCAEGGVLRTDSPASTMFHYRVNDMARARFRRNLITDYLDDHSGPGEDGSAIITAGVPGAGKSTMLAHRVDDTANYRQLDADVVKVALIEKALKDGLYDDLLSRTLDDGYNIAPLELAALVHRESTILIDVIRAECIARRENVIIEGTLTWPGHADVIYDQLAAAGYRRILVLGVEVERAVAHRQALSRWWNDRVAWSAGGNILGGRYTPAYAIDDGYDADSRSLCARHAMGILDKAKGGDVESVDVEIYTPSTVGVYEIIDKGEYRR